MHTIKMCVSTIPSFKASSLLVKKIREVNADAIIIVRSHDIGHAKELYDMGATYVVMPHYLGAKYASHMISRHGLDKKKFEKERETSIRKIEGQWETVLEHQMKEKGLTKSQTSISFVGHILFSKNGVFIKRFNECF